MGWYEAIKDGIIVAQKADNIPLVSELIDAQKQILDLVQENQKLKEENEKLLKKQDISQQIERHKDAYITLKNDTQKLIYCSNCWDTKQQLVQAQTDENGHYECPGCKTFGYYDKAKFDSQTAPPIYVV
ncbi:MAG: hypothetical protein IKT41_01665 [Clostridia bacterium]|nr:hypothetical protein [Clostridia bacterium]